MTGPRVLYVIDSLAPGGAERSLAEVAPHLVRHGVVLEIALLHDRPGFAAELSAAGVPVLVLNGTGRGAWLRDLVRVVGARRPDAVHTTLYDADQVGRLAGAWRRARVASSLVNVSYGPEHVDEIGLSARKLHLARAVDIATARLVHRFHAVSVTVAAEVGPRLHVRPDRIEVIPRGRDAVRLGRRTPERRRRARHALGLGGSEPVLVALARHEPQKRLDVLVRALPAVLRVFPGARLLVAGREGRHTPAIRQAIAELHLDGSAALLGPHDDVPDLLCAADLLVLPTAREGLPGSLLEAMALETPIVASDLPTVREVVDEATAVLVPVGPPDELGRRIVATLEDPDGMRARAELARRRFESEFTIEVSASRLARFYEALAPRR